MSEVTILLDRMARGDAAAGAELLPLVYAELHRLAERSFARQPREHTLQATALVHEAWMRLARDGAVRSTNGRDHFLRTAAVAMRQILVDHARAKVRDKRGGGGERLQLDGLEVSGDVRAEDILGVDEALTELRAADAELAELVELRYFGGYPMPQVAELLGVSLSTAERRWRVARTWLRRALM